MSGRDFLGASWTRELPYSPSKPKVLEQKIEPVRPLKFERDIDEVLCDTPPQPREIPDSESDALNDDDDDEELPSLEKMVARVNPSASPATRSAPKKPSRLGPAVSSDGPSPEKAREDFMALIKDAEEADELDRIQAAADCALSNSPVAIKLGGMDERALYERAVNLVQDEAGEYDSDQEQHFVRVRQAMERQAATPTAPCYYFFAPAKDDASGPKGRGTSSLDSLKVLNNPQQIRLAFQSKLATKYLVTPGIDLSDELIVWILNVFPAERSEEVREEYLQILTRTYRTGHLVNESQLRQWFLSIGADEEAVRLGGKARFARQRDAPKRSRDWTAFYSILELLRRCGDMFRVDTLIQAVLFLLRASMDSELRLQATAAAAVNDTLVTMISYVDEADREKFCRKVCNLFVQTVDSACLLTRAVEATHHAELRLSTPREDFMPLNDLRTRLQLSVFFKDGEKATPERCGTAQVLVQNILERLNDPEFKVRGRDVDYYDLDGYGLALTEIIPFLHSLRQLITDKAAVTRFDDAISSLRRKINYITSNVQIIGPVDGFDARYEAKTRWQGLEYRISHFFPRRGAEGIFNDQLTVEEVEAEKRRLEKQQSFLANFLQRTSG